MTRKPSLAACLTVGLLALSLLPAPATAEGLPQPTLGFHDCFENGDAGNSFDEARSLWAGELQCTGWLLLDDEQDWYRVHLEQGQSYSASVYPTVFSFHNDVDLCAYAPDDAETPLMCSKNPPLWGDWVYFQAAQTGEYRLQLVLALGAGPYQLTTWASPPWRPPPYADFAITDIDVRKAVLGTDLGSTGVVNPAGRWTISVTLENVGEAGDCADLHLGLWGSGTPLTFFLPAPTHWANCLSPGQRVVREFGWRPIGFVGDVRIEAVADLDFDSDWRNNERHTNTFVLVTGL